MTLTKSSLDFLFEATEQRGLFRVAGYFEEADRVKKDLELLGVRIKDISRYQSTYTILGKSWTITMPEVSVKTVDKT